MCIRSYVYMVLCGYACAFKYVSAGADDSLHLLRLMLELPALLLWSYLLLTLFSILLLVCFCLLLLP